VIRINLLPPEYEAAQAKKEQQIYFGGVGALALVILAGFWLFEAGRASALETKILNAQAELSKYQAIVSQIEKIESDKSKLAAKRDVIKNLNMSRLAYPVFFEDLLPIVPGDAWITNLVILEQGGGNMKVTMNASALSNFALATWLTNLQQSKHFTGVDLSPIAYAQREGVGGQVLSFTLTCNYKHQGPFPLQEGN